MGIIEILQGKQPFWKSTARRRWIDQVEQEFGALINTPAGPNTHRVPTPNYRLDTDIIADANSVTGVGTTTNQDDSGEIRTTTTITTDGVTRFQILRTNNTQQNDVIEISVQPSVDCHVQIFEGNAPLSAVRFVPQNRLYSEPGKLCNSSLYIFSPETNVILQVEVRSIPV